MDIELTELRYFLNVARAGSFAEGARRSHVTAAAVSKAIKKLEATLGKRLLDRNSRRVTVTSAGEVVMDYSRRLLGTLGELESALDEGGRTLRGDLSIGASEAFTAYALPLAVARIVALHPQLTPRVYRTVSGQTERLVASGRLDVGLTFAPAATATGRDDRHVLAQSPTAVVCGRGHPLYDQGPASAKALLECPFVAIHGLHQQGAPELGLAGSHPIGATVDSLALAVALAEDGAFLAHVPQVAIRCQLNHGELRVVEGISPGPPFEMAAVTAGTRASIVLLIALLRETVAEAMSVECAVPG